MASVREVVEGEQEQGANEIIIWQITLAVTPDSLTSTTVTSIYGDEDVTATVMPSGSASAVDALVSLPALKLLTAGQKYRVALLYVSGSNTLEDYFIVKCTA